MLNYRTASLILFMVLLPGCSHRTLNDRATRIPKPVITPTAPSSLTGPATTRPTASRIPTQPVRPSMPAILHSPAVSNSVPVPPPKKPQLTAPTPRQGTDPLISVAAVGDLMFNDLEPRGGLYPLAGAAAVFRSVDVAFANLEAPLTYRGVATTRKSAEQLEEHKQWILRGSPAFARAVTASGINVVSCANNHNMDWGPVGMWDTQQCLDAAGVRHAGSGLNSAAAHEPAVLQVKGRRIAVLAYLAFQSEGGLYACTPSGPLSPGVAIIPAGDGGVSRAGMAVLRRDINHARGMADLVFVSFHWGIERQPLPTEYQRRLAHAAVDFGADMVLGGHPHVLEPLEQYRGAPIIYSLGNFVAPNSSGPLGETLILLTLWRGRQCLRVEVLPVRIVGGQPAMLRGADAAEASSRFRLLCGMTPVPSIAVRPQRPIRTMLW